MARKKQIAARLADISDHPLRPLSKTETKTARAALKEVSGASAELAAALEANEELGGFLTDAFTLSPFLRDTATAEPAALAEAISLGIAQGFAALIAEAREAWRPGENSESVSEAELMARLRRIKRRAALHLALVDLARLTPTSETTAKLSDLAGATLSAAVDFSLLALDDAGKITLADRAAPSAGSGLIVLGMGKLGAGELNYSSDIDIVVFFEPEAGILKDPLDGADIFSKMARRLIRIMQERTGDGYVFRTDLRLRPDPGSTPLAIPVEAALNYYEGRGQNWERAAYIKARPIAGDLDAGKRLIGELVPFVFRKYLDYAAIADIHSIKRQIHAHKGFGDIAVKGHNVKLGRGGIREIEFFVQTQQLIAGGRMPELRGRRTDEMLDGLQRARWIGASTAEEMTEAYWYLRDIEHRIQMVHDEQSHTLPETEAELKRIAYLAGYRDTESFSEDFVKRLKVVERHYAELFEHEAHLSGEEGNLVFTGESDDPDTLKTIEKLGFERPENVSKIIRTWHYGRYRATQSAEARERLTELTPDLLRAFGQTKRADEAFLRFDGFVSGLPSGIQLFSLIGSNPNLMSRIVTIMSSAPRLADIIARKPHIFDGMLDPALLAELPTREHLKERLDAFLDGDFAYEEILDRLRIVAAEQRFLIGIRLLTGAITGTRAGTAMSDLADLILETTLKAVEDEVAEAHGHMPGGRIALIGMGKLGSREMTAGSDIDMILIYDDAGAEESDGARPLDPPRYYARLTQRLVAALSAPTAEGVLYEVDLRLRPSGNKGPVATSIKSFDKYQRNEAWTWEHMALSRARPVGGDPGLSAEVEETISAVLSAKRDRATTAGEVMDMRRLMDEEKPPKSEWDLKLIPGGLVDIEFVAQFLALVRPIAEKPRPTLTADVLRALAPDEIGADAHETLLRALALYTEISQMLRLCLDSDFDPREAPAGLIDQLCRVAGMPDLKTLKAEIKTLSREVRQILRTTLTDL